jgi:hypothetical protein
MNEAIALRNNKVIEDKIKSWLRQARDRDAGRKRLSTALSLRKKDLYVQ